MHEIRANQDAKQVCKYVSLSCASVFEAINTSKAVIGWLDADGDGRVGHQQWPSAWPLVCQLAMDVGMSIGMSMW